MLSRDALEQEVGRLNELTDRPEYYSMVDLVREGHDVIIARTFSKIYGMAGMRVGYLLASEATTEQVKRYSLGNYMLNQAGVAAAVASMNDQAFVDFSRARIHESREMIVEDEDTKGGDQ